jgi:hypothetical protein
MTSRPSNAEFLERLSSEWSVPIVGNDGRTEFARGVGSEVTDDLWPLAQEA